jgi:hypothetical protein
LSIEKDIFNFGGYIMWVITVFSKKNTTMFEFDTEEEAREAFENIPGSKIISEIFYFNDYRFACAVESE